MKTHAMEQSAAHGIAATVGIWMIRCVTHGVIALVPGTGMEQAAVVHVRGQLRATGRTGLEVGAVPLSAVTARPTAVGEGTSLRISLGKPLATL